MRTQRYLARRCFFAGADVSVLYKTAYSIYAPDVQIGRNEEKGINHGAES